MMKRMLSLTLSLMFVLSMVSLTLAQTAAAPAAPAGPPQVVKDMVATLQRMGPLGWAPTESAGGSRQRAAQLPVV